MLAAAVIAPPWISFCILVGQDRTLRFKNGPGNDVFGGNQFYLILLATEFAPDRRGDGRIAISQ